MLSKYVKNLRMKAKSNEPPSLREASERMGIKLTTLSSIEKGLTKHPSQSVLEKIAAFYGITLKDLVGAMYEIKD